MKTQQIKNKKCQYFNTNLENKNITKIVQTFKINDCQGCEYKILYTFFQKLKNFASWRSFKKIYKQNVF